MTKERNGKLNVDSILALVLFGVFAVCVLLVLLQGARCYERLTRRGQDSYNERTAVQYIITRVRQADAAGAVSLGMTDGIQTLQLTESIDGENYVTRVYCYNGEIRELFSAEKFTFSPQDGQSIIAAEDLGFELDGSLLKINIVYPDGGSAQFCVNIRSGGGSYEE